VQTGVNNAVLEMEKDEQVSQKQSIALEETITAFKNIAATVEVIADNIKDISYMSTELNKNATDAGQSISNIAAISQENAAATEEIEASNQEQMTIANNLVEEMTKLTNSSLMLEKGIEEFIV
jgi:methyl-accepting chemotaxis protein